MSKLRGVFTFAVYDSNLGRVLAANDCNGSNSLWQGHVDDSLVVACNMEVPAVEVVDRTAIAAGEYKFGWRAAPIAYMASQQAVQSRCNEAMQAAMAALAVRFRTFLLLSVRLLVIAGFLRKRLSGCTVSDRSGEYRAQVDHCPPARAAQFPQLQAQFLRLIIAFPRRCHERLRLTAPRGCQSAVEPPLCVQQELGMSPMLHLHLLHHSQEGHMCHPTAAHSSWSPPMHHTHQVQGSVGCHATPPPVRLAHGVAARLTQHADLRQR